MRVCWKMVYWVALLSLLAGLVAPAAASTPVPTTKFPPEFLRQMLEAPAGQTFRFLLTVPGEAELSAAGRAGSVAEQRAAVVSQLQAAAEAGQAELLPALTRLQDDGHIDSFRSFWVFNGVAGVGDREALLALAARDDVVSIRPDRWLQWRDPAAADQSGRTPGAVDWGIARIRADEVWSALRVDGAGVTVAILDSGVDWQHPALQTAYRGWTGGTPIHVGNWYDATGAGALYPVDSLWHGTHVAGLAVGQDGVGAAPGARWIAARAFSSSGYGLDSWIHDAFQWLLAPAGNPALAPDIVNNSWSNPAAANQEFRPDLQALLAAGILPVFSAGNFGPSPESLGSPASLPESFAVGATDPDDEVALFSSRGPGPFGGVKPEVTAPGVNLLSALPGGGYGLSSGTSMAAPLVSGLAALLWQANPALSIAQATHIISSTAVPLGSPWPNYDYGWGRIDALSAVASVINPGCLEGTVTGFGSGPLAGAAVRATEHGGGASAGTQTAADGSWSLALAPGVYDLEASYFGYAPATVNALAVVTGTVTRQDVTLSPLPGGKLSGRVTAADDGHPLPAMLRVVGTPVTATATGGGMYEIDLPAGSYTITAERWGYRVGQAAVSVTIGGSAVQDFALGPSPRLLLVDGGAWYYGSEVGYFQTALADERYLFRDWRIKTLPADTPTITDLLPYDGVIWTSPWDSPGYIDAGDVISEYLSASGSLLISGQDVGFWDSGASGFVWSPYYRERLKARFLDGDAESAALSGTAGAALDGLALTLNGTDSAQNQQSPDRVTVWDWDTAGPLLDYADGEGHGGVAAGLCLPYRSAYLSAGLEGVTGRAERAEVMGRVLAWFVSPRVAVGAELLPVESLRIAPAGGAVTHTLRLRNTGEAGMGDSYALSLAGGSWSAMIVTPTVTLSPCQSAEVLVRVEVPDGLAWDRADTVTLMARSAVSPTLVVSATLVTKTPAPVLLVDDDLWYPQEDIYRQALDAANLAYDYWDANLNGWMKPGAPPTSTLRMYPLVVWFTGYDWYRPLSNQETSNLEDYLAAGGRLFLTSQDALYYQSNSELSSHYLGVVDYTEDVSPTIAYGAEGQLDLSGVLPLAYPFQNFSDGIIPAASASVELYGNTGWPVAQVHHPPGADWKSAFFAFPFETLPAGSRPAAMEQVVGWLGWLGESEWEASARSVPAGQVVTFTATLRNDGPLSVTATLSNPLPAGLELVTGTLAGGDYAGTAVHWQGQLHPGGEHAVRYVAVISQAITNTAAIGYDEHGLVFQRPLRVWVDAPDLSPSLLQSTPPAALPGQPVSYTLLIRNGGPAGAPAAMAHWLLPAGLTVLSDTLQVSSDAATLDGRQVEWSGSLAAGEVVTVSVAALTLPGLDRLWFSSSAVLDDGLTELLVRGHLLEVRPLRFYLPLIFR